MQGSATLSYETRSLTQDRARTFMLDAMDVDETNFVASAGNVMSDFQRRNVIPEIDAYRYSAIYALLATAEHVSAAGYTPDESTIFEALLADIAAIQDVIGESIPLVISMSYAAAQKLDLADKISKQLSVADFKQGTISTKVRSLDGTPIIRVPSARFKTAYEFYDGATQGQTAGGFVPADDAQSINWIITARTAPIAVSKTEKIRIFDPDSNQKADAWKLDYRKYHDLWLPDNAIDGCWANATPLPTP